MKTSKRSIGVFEEIAELFAAGPNPDEVLGFHPSHRLQAGAEELLEKLGAGQVSEAERQELEEFARAEDLMRLVKAKIRARRAQRA